MSGPLVNQRLEVFQGVDAAETFLFFTTPVSGSTDPIDMVPTDFTAATGARLMVKPSSDASGTALLSLTIGAGLAWTSGTIVPGPPAPIYNNGIAITVTKAQSLAANAGRATAAYYDLLVDWANGTTTLLCRGTFEFAPTATR